MGWIAVIKLQISTRFSINGNSHFMCIIRFHIFKHIKYYKIINTDTCMPRGGRNYKLFFCPQLHNRYIYIYIYLITFFSPTTYQPTFLEVHPKNKLQVQHPSGRFCWKSLFPAQRRRCCSRPMAWLVVWNMFFMFPYIYIHWE